MKTCLASLSVFLFSTVLSCSAAVSGFVHVKGHDLVDEKGEKYFIRGTNLGHWLNPEGYMFGFGKCSSPHMIDEMFKQLVGPEETRKFWKAFKENYITEQKNRPDRAKALQLMREYVENCKFENCKPENAYLKALGLKEM